MFSEIYCVMTGRVQRVGFRAFVESVASLHGVTGWVQNREDGSVHIVLQGLPDVLKRCSEDLQNGSVLSRVESSAVEWRTPQEQFDDFRILSGNDAELRR